MVLWACSGESPTGSPTGSPTDDIDASRDAKLPPSRDDVASDRAATADRSTPSDASRDGTSADALPVPADADAAFGVDAPVIDASDVAPETNSDDGTPDASTQASDDGLPDGGPDAPIDGSEEDGARDAVAIVDVAIDADDGPFD